jgi:hypothetical protein
MPPKRERKSKKATVEEVIAEPPAPAVEPVVETAAAPAAAPAVVPVVVPVVEPKKRGKKQPKIVALVTPDGIQGTFHSEPRRPLIAHLQVNPSTINFFNGSLHYDPAPPTQPQPYEPGFDNYFTTLQETLELKAGAKQETPEQPEEVEGQSEEFVTVAQPPSTQPNDPALPMYSNHDLMVQFRDTTTSKKLPARSDIACFWCAHTFENVPCIVPEREEGGIYRVYGNFCCPECAVAFLLEETVDSTTRWERMALLHRIYGPFYNYKRIFPAPARASLKLFGGPMSIQSYRNTVRERKVRVDIQIPPMMSILGSLDTKPIDFYDTSLRTTFSPLLQESLPKAEENLRLKRSKPLKDKESTLDSVMNIQIRVKRAGTTS